ncbi:MAG: helix-turn-helix transcriptional regulator [Asticcacaulis sp.]|nr:helix-turn-helix transcriptional regulator [Asticcacaulis sp.]
MDVQKLIGWNLSRLRLARRLSQEELALRTEIIGQGYVSGLERGRRNPTAVTLVLLARALDVQVGELFSITDAPPKIVEGPVRINSTRSGVREV